MKGGETFRAGRRAWLTLGASILVLLACSNGRRDLTTASAAQTAGPMGVLAGRVTRGPSSPVEGSGPGRPAPAVGVRVLAAGPGGQSAGSAVTDPRGVYRILLPAGTYTVTLGTLRGLEFTKDLPATVTIAPESETRLDIRVDTGIR